MKNQQPKQKSDYYLEMLNDELLLYHPSSTRIYQLNATAALIWQLCNGERTVDEIISLLTAAYPTISETLRQDADATIRQFATQGMIEFV